jgi:hypothetical protein
MCAALYRGLETLSGNSSGGGAVAPFDFLMSVLFGLSGALWVLVLLSAWCGAGGGVHGLLPAAAAGGWLVACLDMSTRVWMLPQERENWALPFLALRSLALVLFLKVRASTISFHIRFVNQLDTMRARRCGHLRSRK